ncbi:GNAT family N-acetyltransferase [Streptomyces sp. NPDC096198]|uniref:GNAT family N-acetyltransferase n=1 Tax=Streptomyces sp. NPDC096198 TaxID=3366080 RepID=UPI00382901BD
MTLVRRALPEDAAELLRLRQVMLEALYSADSAPWHAESLPTLRRRLGAADEGFAAFVIDSPDRPDTLAALAVGTVEYRIGRPGNPQGRAGHVFSVTTDPGARRRGYARACMEALLGWLREQGVRNVDLNASAQAEPLYAALGFVRKPDPSMRLTL